MKRLAVLAALAALASACHINDTTFTPLGGGADDANGDSSNGLIDAPPSVPPMTRGFLSIQGGGLAVLNKAPNGDITAAPGSPVSTGSAMAMAVATNRTGTHVYVGLESAVAGSQLVDIPFTGTTAGTSTTKGLPCAPRHIVVHPSQTNLVVGCAQPQMFSFPLDAAGAVVGTAVQIANSGQGESFVAITPDGACLFNSMGLNGNMRVTAYIYNAAGSNGYTLGASYGGPPNTVDLVMHPDGKYVYLVTDTVVQAFAIQSGCTLVGIGGSVPVGMSSPLAAQIDPQGGRFVVLGDRIAPFRIEADGHITLIAASGLNGSYGAGKFDAALPDTMYTTNMVASMPGVFQQKIDAGGVVTLGQGFVSSGVPSDFALAP